ncbi:hypothetical protein AB0942_26195 [Streptomyces nodosus]|uniref:hypothetical protein n=1 Tax=Streptomyces nodosus TaxID=40318 RepID=UPI003453D9EE
MEQRIGSSSQPLDGVGVDPAFIPGLTSPLSTRQGTVEDERKDSAEAEQEDSAEVERKDPADTLRKDSAEDGKDPIEPEESAEEGRRSPAGPEDTDPEEEKPADDAPDASEGSEEPGSSEEPEKSDESEEPEEQASEGPAFEAADRRARIVADHSGVRLRLDDQDCEFRWDEIGAVETETARFGKRFTVTVHTTDRRWYPIEVEAPARSRFKEWEAALDEVLDAYFEDGTETEPATPEKDDTDD